MLGMLWVISPKCCSLVVHGSCRVPFDILRMLRSRPGLAEVASEEPDSLAALTLAGTRVILRIVEMTPPRFAGRRMETTMKLTGAVAVLLVLLCACSGWADMAQIVIYPGENWISLPLIPFDAAPSSVFSGLDIDGNLSRLDAATGEIVTYNATSCGTFGSCLLGEGYRITSSLSTPVVISYQGVADGVPDAEGHMTDMWIALPGRDDGLDQGGVHWIGMPFNHSTPIERCLVTDGRQTLTIAQAVQTGLIDGLWDSIDNETKQPLKVGLGSLNPDRDVLQPGMMYQITTHTNRLALIVPADVSEPAGWVAVLCGLGGIRICIRRRGPLPRPLS